MGIIKWIRTALLLHRLVLESQQSQIIFYLELKWTVVNSDKPALQSILNILPLARGNLSWLGAWLRPLYTTFTLLTSAGCKSRVKSVTARSVIWNKQRGSYSMHLFYPQQKAAQKNLRQNSTHLGNFMGGPGRNQENQWEVRCQIWWYCWIFRISYFLGKGYSPHHSVIFIEP